VRPRLGRVALALGAVSVLAALTGCASSATFGADEYGAEIDVAERFFAALEEGNTATALSLTTGELGIRPDVATATGLYADADDRPRDASIVSAVEVGESSVYVDVDFTLGGDQRSAKLEFDRSASEPLITGWLFSSLPVAAHAEPGELIISDDVSVDLGDEAFDLVLLPGRYDFRYEGPGRAAGESFTLDFPFESQEMSDALPDGIDIPFASLEIDQSE
jgi:hypothetical protein